MLNKDKGTDLSHQNETELRTTLYSIGDAVIATDIAGRITRMNPVAEQLTGWNETEALGQSLDNVIHIINENTRRPLKSLVTRVLDAGKAIELANHTLLISKGIVSFSITERFPLLSSTLGKGINLCLILTWQNWYR